MGDSEDGGNKIGLIHIPARWGETSTGGNMNQLMKGEPMNRIRDEPRA